MRLNSTRDSPVGRGEEDDKIVGWVGGGERVGGISITSLLLQRF